MFRCKSCRRSDRPLVTVLSHKVNGMLAQIDGASGMVICIVLTIYMVAKGFSLCRFALHVYMFG